MKRVVFACALAAITFAAAYGTSNAAPIAPLPEGVATSSGNIVKAYYWHHHYYHHRHWYRIITTGVIGNDAKAGAMSELISSPAHRPLD